MILPIKLVDLCMARSIARLTQEPEYPVLTPGLATNFSPSADSKRAVVKYSGKHVHLVLVKHFGGLGLLGNSVARLTHR